MSEVQIDKTKSRDNYWDTLKVMLIFLVVYGHIVTHYTNSNQLNTSIYNWIFLFHMPLFVFVSGRFSHIRDKNKYRKGILKIAETYIFFQFIRVFLRYLTGHGLNVIAALTSPSYTLWYLLCLIFWRLLALFIGEDNMKKHCKLILSLSILLCFLGGFIQTNIFSLQRFLSFLPFFVLGYYSTMIDIKKYIKLAPRYITISFLLLSFVILYLHFNSKITFLYGSQSFVKTTDCFYKMGLFLIQLLMCYCFLSIVPLNDKTLCKWGNTTLFVYLFHSFFTEKITHLPLPSDCFSILIYSLILTISLMWISRFSFSSFMLNPVSYIVDRITNRKIS